MIGENVLVLDRAGTPPDTSDTSTLHVTQLFDRGPLEAQFVLTAAKRAELYGGEVPYSIAPAAIDRHFAEGGTGVWITRVVGPNAVAAFRDFSDGANPCLRIAAKNPGEWGNGLSPEIAAAPGGYKIIVREGAKIVSESGPLVDLNAAVDFGAASRAVTVTRLAGTNNPVVVAGQALQNGTDDRANITQVQRNEALARLKVAASVGQIASPGVGTVEMHAALLAHALETNRFAALDAPAGASEATLTTLATAARALGFPLNRAGSLFSSWATFATSVAGGTQDIPYSAVWSAQCARNDADGRVARAIANERGRSLAAVGLSRTFNAAAHERLNDLGVTVAVVEDGAVLTMGDRTLADPVTQAEWVQASVGRYIMSYAARARTIARRYRYAGPDGIPALHGELADAALGDLEQRELVTRTGDANDAFEVRTGPSVNTDATLAARQINAEVDLRPATSAETVTVRLFNVPLEASIA